MSALRQREDALFAHWRDSLQENDQTAFVTDGAVDPIAYSNTYPKILLLLKEVNDPGPGGGGWDLREFLRNGGRPQTWNMVTQWLLAIRRLPDDLPWSFVETVGDSQRVEQLASIAAMNLKKTPGGAVTENTGWWSAVTHDKAYIQEQLDLYHADLIICCGSIVADAFIAYLTGDRPQEWKRTSRGVKYLEYEEKRYVISYSHPEARASRNLIHYGLVDAVRELFVEAADRDVRTGQKPASVPQNYGYES